MANELTQYNAIPKPDEAALISADVAVLQNAFDMIDSLINTLNTLLSTKAATAHGHAIADITGLASELAGKMAASRTFTLAELTDVAGAASALENYILTKVEGVYAFRSAISVLGEHSHEAGDITGTFASSQIPTLAQSKITGLSAALSDLVSGLEDKADASALTPLSNAIAGKANTADPELTGDIFLNGRARRADGRAYWRV